MLKHELIRIQSGIDSSITKRKVVLRYPQNIILFILIATGSVISELAR